MSVKSDKNIKLRFQIYNVHKWTLSSLGLSNNYLNINLESTHYFNFTDSKYIKTWRFQVSNYTFDNVT